VQAAAANGARLLKELKLAEVSVVRFPMNPAAMVTSVKAEDCPAKQLLNYLWNGQ
jgi:phage head maturation protease